MFLPYFIAILLGFISPSNSSSANCNNNGVVTTQDNPPGDGLGGDGTGTPGPGTGGDQGVIPPPKP